jgi:hypothetical protein
MGISVGVTVLLIEKHTSTSQDRHQFLLRLSPFGDQNANQNKKKFFWLLVHDKLDTKNRIKKKKETWKLTRRRVKIAC